MKVGDRLENGTIIYEITCMFKDTALCKLYWVKDNSFIHYEKVSQERLSKMKKVKFLKKKLTSLEKELM